MRLLLPLFLLLPLAEIAGFIIVGGEIGVLNTLLLILSTGVLGILLVRRQGLDTLARARARMDRGEPPVQEAFDGICLALAGVLLIVPGFVTDLFGVLLFLPPVRQWLFRRMQVVPAAPGPGAAWRDAGQPRYRAPDVIEADYVEVTPPGRRTDTADELPPPDSRWRGPER